MRLGIDIDGVLANFTQGYADVIRKVSGRDLLTPEMIASPPSWNWDRDAGYTKEEESAAWKFVGESPDFWYNLPELPGLQDIMEADPFTNHDVYFITARPGVHVKRQTEDWLDSMGILFPTVLVSDNKGPLAVGLKLDVLIDDRDKNIIEVSQASPTTQCYILDYPYNRHVMETYNIHRVYSVKQAMQEVLNG